VDYNRNILYNVSQFPIEPGDLFVDRFRTLGYIRLLVIYFGQ
jgi:hypothetical protein